MLLTIMMATAVVAQGPDFSWSGALAAGKQLTVKNISGDITVEPARGGTVEITAVKRAGRRGDPADVTVRRIETARGIEVCVVYPGWDNDDGDCDWNGRREDRREGRRWENDTRVDFTVRLPAGVLLNAASVSGDVQASGLRADAEVASVSGDVTLRDVRADRVEAHSVSGEVELLDVEAAEASAQSVSGDIAYRGSIRSRGAYEFETVSGDVVITAPSGFGAEVRFNSMSGDLRSDFDITREGSDRSRFLRRRIEGTIGDGSARIRVNTLSGDVELRAKG